MKRLAIGVEHFLLATFLSSLKLHAAYFSFISHASHNCIAGLCDPSVQLFSIRYDGIFIVSDFRRFFLQKARNADTKPAQNKVAYLIKERFGVI